MPKEWNDEELEDIELEDEAEDVCPNCGQPSEGETTCANCGAILTNEDDEFETFDEDEEY